MIILEDALPMQIPERKPLSLGQKIALGAGTLGLVGLGAAGVNHFMHGQDEIDDLTNQRNEALGNHLANNAARTQEAEAGKNEAQSSYMGPAMGLGMAGSMAGMLMMKKNPKLAGAMFVGAPLGAAVLGAGANALFNRSDN